MSKIINRFSKNLICEDALLELKELAIKYKASLRGADLRGADLRGADLCGADLCGADLCGANLRGADLCGADLCGADLCGADLCDADLCDAKNIQDTFWLKSCKRDILYIFSYVPKIEVENLRKKIIDGKINGTQYEGECCCLIGSLGNDKITSSIPYYEKGLHNTGEQLFFQIREGDTPETNQFSKIALDLCDEFLAKL